MDTATQTPEVLSNTLTAADRCDGCGGQAFIKVQLLDSELLFCRHHWLKPGTQEKLEPIAVAIIDESYKLTARPTGYLEGETTE